MTFALNKRISVKFLSPQAATEVQSSRLSAIEVDRRLVVNLINGENIANVFPRRRQDLSDPISYSFDKRHAMDRKITVRHCWDSSLAEFHRLTLSTAFCSSR